MRFEYSKKELALIRYFKLEAMLETIFPPIVYREMALVAFITDDQSIFAESVRRCIRALSDCTAYRTTPEFEALIDDAVLES